MEVLIKSRRAIRNYLNENLEPDLIERMLEVTGYAPSGKNDRKLLFTVVDDLKVLARIREEAMAALSVLVESGRLPASLEFFTEIVGSWQTGKVDILFRGAPMTPFRPCRMRSSP
jgi:nitroreductase